MAKLDSINYIGNRNRSFLVKSLIARLVQFPVQLKLLVRGLMLVVFLSVLNVSSLLANDWNLRPVSNENSNLRSDPNQFVPVYSRNSKILLGKEEFGDDYKLVKREANWLYVRFAKPTVKAWISERFVRVSDQPRRLVTFDRVNIRIDPSIDSRILGIVSAGGELLASGSRKDGFVQIYAPQNFVFAIKSEDVERRETLVLDRQAEAEQAVIKDAKPKSTEGTIYVPQAEQLQNQSLVPEGNDTQAFELDSNLTSEQAQGANVVTERANPLISVVQPPVLAAPTTNISLSASTPLTERSVYKVAAGDSISLQVFGEPDLSAANLRVPLTGQVGFPLIGTMKVAGMRIEQIEQEVRRRLQSGYIKNPRLSVTITEYRPVFVKGAVKKVGQFEYTEGLTIAKLLLLAELKPSAKINSVALSRDSRIIAQGLSVESSAKVSPGDVISVEQEFGLGGQEDTSFVYLHGEVRNPGAYEFVRGLTVEKAVVLAGGFSLRASRKRISITREVPSQIEPEKLKKVNLYEPVQPGDIIDVGASWF